MKKLLWIIIALIVVFAAFRYLPRKSSAPTAEMATSTVATSTPTGTPVTMPSTEKILPYGAVKLALGERAKFADFAITPTALVEDSRCPAGVYCIQAGTVKVKVAVYRAGATSTETFALGIAGVTGGFRITLTDVAPLKTASHTITDKEYEFTFRVERSSSGSSGPSASAGCYVGGCSKEVCSSDPNAVSTCIYSPQYACYKTATCERQSNGECGWTQTQELQMCLAENAGASSVQ